MNRLRLWLFVALLLLAGVGNLYFLSSWLAARSIAQIDRDLRGAAAQLDARARTLGADAGDLAEAAARTPAVVAGLAEAAMDPLTAAEEVIRPLAVAAKIDAGRVLVAVAGTRGAQARVAGRSVPLPESPPFLSDPQRGARREAFARLDEALWVVAGAPGGRGSAVAVGLPLDAGFAAALRATSGVEVTLIPDAGRIGHTTLPPDDGRAAAAVAAQPPRRPADVERLGSVATSLPLPPLPLLFVDPPAHRAMAIPLEGVPGAAAVLSVPTAQYFAGLATYQAIALGVLLALLAIGILLGALMTEADGAVPRALIQPADRIARGDFTARAPKMAGTAGVLASALNRAAAAAEGRGGPPAPAREEQPAEPAAAASGPATEAIAATPASVTTGSPAPDELRAAALEAQQPPAEVEPDAAWSAPAPPLDEPSRADGAMPEPPPPPEVPAPALVAPAAEAAPADVRSPADEPDASPSLAGAPGSAGPASREPEPPRTPRSVPPAVDRTQADDEEAHWRTVFDDFLRVRAQTGEITGQVSYDRFRAKLQRNRDQLREKYGCRTVRFQVYTKDGKAAVRATPVR